jgi:hypothetical protein
MGFSKAYPVLIHPTEASTIDSTIDKLMGFNRTYIICSIVSSGFSGVQFGPGEKQHLVHPEFPGEAGRPPHGR